MDESDFVVTRDYDLLFKVVFAGTPGKLGIIMRYVNGEYPDPLPPEQHSDFLIKNEEIYGVRVKLQLWSLLLFFTIIHNIILVY